MYEVRERGGTVVKKVPVDKHMTELTLSLSGDKDDEDILDITLRDPNGSYFLFFREKGQSSIFSVHFQYFLYVQFV